MAGEAPTLWSVGKSKTPYTTSSAPGSDPRRLSGTAKTERWKTDGEGGKEDVGQGRKTTKRDQMSTADTVDSLGVLLLVVVTEEQAGEGTPSVWQPLMETPGDTEWQHARHQILSGDRGLYCITRHLNVKY